MGVLLKEIKNAVQNHVNADGTHEKAIEPHKNSHVFIKSNLLTPSELVFDKHK